MTSKRSGKMGISLPKLVRDALRQNGMTLPETEEEIAAAEEEVKGDQNLPPSLQGRAGFLGRPGRLTLRPPPVPLNTEVEQELARAARAGKELTGEVLERMRRDRDAAEREAKTDEDE